MNTILIISKKVLFYVISLTMIFILLARCSSNHNSIAQRDDINHKVDSLLKIMTLDEKIGQLNQYPGQWEMTGAVPKDENFRERYELIKNGMVGSMLNVKGVEQVRAAQKLAVENSRLGIPMIFGYDVIHGYKTIFPLPLAMSCSWDMEAIQRSARIAAVETAASGINWTFAPMVDISRDARWGRVMEGAGEDPYLGCEIAKAQILGFQGENLKDISSIAACAKHFAGYGFVEAGREYNTAEISENTLQNIVLPPFKACVDAGVATFMDAFNAIGGTPSTSNNHLLRDVLKGEWSYNGFVVSDWGSIDMARSHGVAATKKEAALIAFKAGCDMDMGSSCYLKNLKELVKEGSVKEDLIDDAVRRILSVKYELGLFEDPYRYCDSLREKELLLTEDHLKEARDIARKSIVLLKNENNILPLNKEGLKIAIIGPFANDKDNPLGNWRADAEKASAISLLEGIKSAQTSNNIAFERGPVLAVEDTTISSHKLIFNNEDRTGMKEAIIAAKSADVVIMAIGENCWQSGEARSQADIRLKGLQEELLESVYAVNKNIVVVLMNGRPIVIDWMAEHVPAILETWHLGSESGNAIADVLFGDYNPSGKITASFPRSVGQCPVYYNHKSTSHAWGHPIYASRYIDMENEPLYPFGFGLSYTSFEYSNLKINKKEVASDEELSVSVMVKNTGKYIGDEIVQLYIQDKFASTARPVKELKGFSKIHLTPGESKTVKFKLTANDLAFFTANKKWEAESGEFNVWIGPNSKEGLIESFILN